MHRKPEAVALGNQISKHLIEPHPNPGTFQTKVSKAMTFEGQGVGRGTKKFHEIQKLLVVYNLSTMMTI